MPKEDYIMKRSPEETALLISLLFKRSGQKRGRLSGNTIRLLSKRQYLRVAFLHALQEQLDDFGFVLLELERGGFGIIPISALDGAPAITAKKYLAGDLTGLKRGKIDFEDIRRDLELDAEESNDTDE